MAPAVPVVYTGQKESRSCSQKSLMKTMGRSKKFPKGQPTGFVPDYYHAVETMAESEGFGSSGRVDMEMTLSEDSCSPKRKCISLNRSGNDRFGVPVQVHSLSKMSRSERKDLEVRLKRELELVRVLQNKVASLNTNAVVLSPFSDIHNCSDGHKRPPIEGSERPQPVQDKKRVPPGRNGPGMKKGAPGQIEPAKSATPASTSNALLMKQCEYLLDRLMGHQFGWVFNVPVDVVKLNIPDYFQVIKHPMDLGTIKSKLAAGEYSSPQEFAADVRLTFSNAMTYNPPKNDVHFMAKTLSKYFEARWKPIEKKIPAYNDSDAVPPRAGAYVENEISDHIAPSKKKKAMPPAHAGKPEPVKRVVTDEEKHKLSMELEALLAELPESIVDFLKDNCLGSGQTGEDEIEIDIDALSDDVLFKLRKMLDDFLLDKKKNQTKAEPCEMEIHNESAFSNSSIQPCKGNDAMEEDVDIGGNDPPITSFPPVQIEKDTTVRSSRCSSSSSSSSESGSSSSDSDTGSSSGSESNGNRAPASAKKPKETVGAAPNIDQNQRDSADEDAGKNETHNGMSQVDQNAQTKPSPDGVDDCKEGENAQCERQVSPEKLYRAALLRSRFADTILKAQEKALDKVEKRDPEKLRFEREELERRKREEKARLRAEARAAEEARKKAEAEAAAEAKRRREMEREAARLALQQMEKTVDINENCQFMEDLEMLRTAPEDNLSTLMNNASPSGSHNDGLGSFRLRGNSNPLEQLGLYMKNDDEEEDEAEHPPKSSPGPGNNDAEEGEID